MLSDIILVIISGLLGGALLESGFRSYKIGEFVAPRLINIQMYVLTALFLYFFYPLRVHFAYKMIFIIVFTTTIEYITGSLYLRHTGERAWNYSLHKLNYRGLISPVFSFVWFILSLGYYFVFVGLLY